ncbi:B-cell receptor CD22 isoform X2 [Lates calcarifer]|uniref:B-cell receptor CD22 n=1 Tax=Lates calcarifer TaxID=8187 RepID=A0AAJ8B4X5_LATCA|nr:B-cell receptor CD22 isoform X2 [Lates calcarifer]
MRGAAMSLTAASGGFVVLLLTVSVVQGQDGWGVTYTSTKICAFKGSTVDIHCTYTYPPRIKGHNTTVERTFWFTKVQNKEPVDLRTDSDYTGRVQYHCAENSCTLIITDLRESDSAVYKFRFITNQDGGCFIGSPGVTVSVSDLQVQVRRSSEQVELRCHSSCNVADHPSYVWYLNGQKMEEERFSLRVSVNDHNRYSCAVKGHEDHCSPPVYPPKLPSVSVSPSGQIVEGSSVTLTCSTDANPAAKYTWYKENDHKYHSQGPQLVFSSIQSSDSGQYYCAAENNLGMRTSQYIFIGVKYAPVLPSVSVSPSGQIVEGSSVNLTCSSDANPAAKYTWYKENEDSPKASGQIFTITDFRAEHSGNYYCEAQNERGRQNSTLHLTVGTSSPLLGNSAGMMNIIRLTLVVLMLIPLLLLILWTRRKKTPLSSTTEPNDYEETVEMDSPPVYEDVSDLKAVTAAETEDTEEQEDVV